MYLKSCMEEKGRPLSGKKMEFDLSDIEIDD